LYKGVVRKKIKRKQNQVDEGLSWGQAAEKRFQSISETLIFKKITLIVLN
jgi:hypothetical protein